MTLDEFLEKCRAADGWHLERGFWVDFRVIRNRRGLCPLQAVFSISNYMEESEAVLEFNPREIVLAADDQKDANQYLRQKLLTLVKP